MMKTMNHVCVLPEGVRSLAPFRHTLPGTHEPTALVLGDDSVIYEAHLFKESCSSWLTSKTVIQDGRLFLNTPVDVLFFIIPILEAKSGEDWINVLECLELKGHLQIKQALERDPLQLDCICESLDQQGETLHRLSEQRVIIWLELKINSLMEALQSVENPEHCTLSYALNLMRSYLTKDWTQKLKKHLSIDEKELEFVEGGTSKSSSRKRQVEDSKLSKAQETRLRKQKKASKGTAKLRSFFTSDSSKKHKS